VAKESVKDVYCPDTPADAATLLDKAIIACRADDVTEVRSLGHTLASWRTEILAHHDTGASNGPTEGLNLCVKKIKRCRRGFKSWQHYRLRVLLHAGGIHVTRKAPTATHQNPLSPVRRVEPHIHQRLDSNLTPAQLQPLVLPQLGQA
jgi:hypothetical protein